MSYSARQPEFHSCIACHCRVPARVTVCLILAACLGATASLPLHADDATVDLNTARQVSVAREWTNATLFAIRRDLARPPVHARNLYHLSAAMYDAWAVFSERSTTVFLSPDADSPVCRLTEDQRTRLRTAADTQVVSVRERAIGYAAWRLLVDRYANLEVKEEVRAELRRVATEQGLIAQVAFDDSAAALGLKVAECVINRGQEDGANESADYSNRRYLPANPPMNPADPGAPSLVDPDRWQPLQLTRFIDQAGKAADAGQFIGAEWGDVHPFALRSEDASSVTRDGNEHAVWFDPGPPPRTTDQDPTLYRDHFALVALWSAHLDPSDGVLLNIAPGAQGELAPKADLLTGWREQLTAYDPLRGGVDSVGHTINPTTGEAYADNMVLRGDYTRVLAEYWADGPDSETPPGHWFRIYNEYVADYSIANGGWIGTGDNVDIDAEALESDVLAYLALGGAMHDSAIAAWSVKGAYDYVRPISALRFMAAQGQSTDRTAANYSPLGLPLIPGRISTVKAGDRLAAEADNIGKIAVYAWRGPEEINNPLTDTAGVGWILAENWWPYQRPNFVTPAFAGYVSGHSTFSRAAAEVLERLTGNAYFPGGLAEFRAPANNFLVFEQGPSTDVVLQWATYRDAADQTSLSRIWGGIHPPADDLPGRRMGAAIGERAWQYAHRLFTGTEAPLMSDEPVDELLRSDTSTVQSTQNASGCSSTGPARAGFEATLLLLLPLAARRVRRRRGSKQLRPYPLLLRERQRENVTGYHKLRARVRKLMCLMSSPE